MLLQAALKHHSRERIGRQSRFPLAIPWHHSQTVGEGPFATPLSDPIHRNPAAVREQLRRILESREFKRARRMGRFLEIVVEETLAGRGDSLNEHFLGVAVFDRPPAFDPSGDPLVRVEARRLRSKLRDYYAGAGAQDTLRIVMPTGQYAPEFSTTG